LTGRNELHDIGRATLQSVQFVMEQAPMAAGQSLIALDFLLAAPREFAVVAGTAPGEYQAVLESLYGRFLPHKVVAPAPAPPSSEFARLVPLLADRPARDGRVTTYICERFACEEPVIGVAGLEFALGKTGSPEASDQ
jgi:uncharacterized protein YyaL (SSP411 family)